MKRFVLASVLLAFAACTPAPTAATGTTPPAEPPAASVVPAMGMLEERLGATTTEPTRFVVRMLFQNDGAGWKSLSPNCNDEACLASAPATLPPSTAWNIVYASEVKGAVTATTPAKWALYADAGTQDVATGTLKPTVGQATLEFSADGATPVYRPLVAVTIPAVSDPDAWEAGSLSAAALPVLHAAFREKFATVTNCATDGGSDLKPMTYMDADVIPSAVSVSAKGWSVATTQLTGYRCDGPFEETAFAPQTFAISPDGKAQYLGESLKLVDTGDFDGNGKSELVFAIQGGNTGGYELYSDDFAGRATFAYTFH